MLPSYSFSNDLLFDVVDICYAAGMEKYLPDLISHDEGMLIFSARLLTHIMRPSDCDIPDGQFENWRPSPALRDGQPPVLHEGRLVLHDQRDLASSSSLRLLVHHQVGQLPYHALLL